MSLGTAAGACAGGLDESAWGAMPARDEKPLRPRPGSGDSGGADGVLPAVAKCWRAWPAKPIEPYCQRRRGVGVRGGEGLTAVDEHLKLGG